MGKLERQIMIGALALVGILVAVVILKGLTPHEDDGTDPEGILDGGTPLMLDGGGALVGAPPAQDPPLAEPVAEPWLDVPPAGLDGAAAQVPAVGDLTADGVSLLPSTETPLVTPVEPAPPVVKDSYTIRKSDTLGHIAQRELGSVRRVKEILDLNPGLDPNNLVVGSVIKLPQGGTPAVKSEATPPATTDGEFLSHTVAAGDSLWALADRYLGDGNRFREIVAANPSVLKSENSVLPLGAKLRIPKK